jgi:hypothetical protein
MADTLVTAYRWRWLALVAVLAAEIMDLIDGTVVASGPPRSARSWAAARR